MNRQTKIFGLFFFISGFCGLVYQVVWLRLAFASFGVVTPVVSVVVSVFMLGLAIGSRVAGKIVDKIDRHESSARLYALAECAIGIGAFCAPLIMKWGASKLLGVGDSSSEYYLLASAGYITLSLTPWCIAMGMTYPLAMDHLRKTSERSEKSFSHLYLMNVAGALLGVSLSAGVMIEFLGFYGTLRFTAILNFLIALAAFGLSQSKTIKGRNSFMTELANLPDKASSETKVQLPQRFAYFILFITGFVSMAMEVVWTRAFTPITKTTIYAFALLLAIYLLATALGSAFYRRQLKGDAPLSLKLVFVLLSIAGLFPLFLNDPRVHPNVFNLIAGLFPFCFVLGLLTPKLIDDASGGDGNKAGTAYAINVLGCILGPLVAGYFLLPLCGVKSSLILLSAILAGAGIFYFQKSNLAAPKKVYFYLSMALLYGLSSLTQSFEDPSLYKNAVVRRDHTATVISLGTGMDRQLAVNGIAITHLTPITKIMMHLPLASLSGAPKSALVICFGMGTTFRAGLSWGIDTTAAELVPSVPLAFGNYYDDANQLLSQRNAHVVVDDGRRFLRRTQNIFDVITLDPPPPVEAAGSSLLYTEEFYDLAKAHLSEGGILQQWFPGGEDKILWGIARALQKSFPYVKVYHSIENWGFHFLASKQPIPALDPKTFVDRLPEAAKKDLMEWYPNKSILDVTTEILSREVPLNSVLGTDPEWSMTDSRPLNEYFLVRRTYARLTQNFHLAP